MVAGISGKLLPRFSYPLDFHRTFRGKRIFGDHKTIRGIILGTIAGSIFFIFQYLQGTKYNQLYVSENYGIINLLLMGFSLSFGGLIGDAMKSFVKRQFNILPGRTWFPFDQIDWILGTIIFSIWFIDFELIFIIWALFIGLILHVLIKLIGYLLKLQDESI